MKGKGLVAKAARDTVIEKEQRRSDTGLYKLMALANSSRCCFLSAPAHLWENQLKTRPTGNICV